VSSASRSPSPRELYLRAVEAFNRRSEEYLDAYSEDAVLHSDYSPFESTREGARKFYRELWSAFPDGKLTLHETVEEGNLFAARYSYEGTHVNDFLGFRATRRRVEITKALMLMRFSRGLIVEYWGLQGDDLAMQLRDPAPG
jgi:predicted ester cyclase